MDNLNLQAFSPETLKSLHAFLLRHLLAILCVLAVLAFGISYGAYADDVDSSEFKSEQEALTYLEQSPRGALAEAAFKAAVEFQLAREYPEFVHSNSEEGSARGGETPVLEGMY